MNTIEKIHAVAPLQGHFVDYFDAKLFVPLGHFDEERMLEGGKPEVHVLGLLSRFVHEGDIVVDVGANIGTHTFALAAIVKDHGRVYAVEADVDNVTCVRASLLASGTKNVVLIAAAAADKPGLIRMLASSGSNSVFSASATDSQIKVAAAVALDCLIEERVAFVKIDIEGAELLALRGLDKTIAHSRPVILSEFSPAYIASALGRDRSDEFFEFFESRDYDCFYVDPFGILFAVADYDALLETYRAAFTRFSWNHIDVLFVPTDHPMPERGSGAARPSDAGRGRSPTRKPLAAATPPAIAGGAGGAGQVEPTVEPAPAQPSAPPLDDTALLDRLLPLVVERLKAARPWRDNIYVPAPDVATVAASSPFMATSTCSVRDFLHPSFARINSLLQQPLRLHRKIWEHVFIVHHFERAKVLQPGFRGLGFGVGGEMLPAVFAGMGADIVATDAPEGIEIARQGSNGQAPGIEGLPSGAMKRADFLRRVSWRDCDMNAIAPDLTDFDFCWSSCCLQHLGDLDAGLDFIVRSVEHTLRPGGVAVHTTELNLSSNDDTIESGQTVLYRRRDIERVMAVLRARGHEVCDLVLSPELLAAGGYVDSQPYALPHLTLALFGFVSTSVGLVVKRGR